MVLRVYVQRKPGFKGEATSLLKEIQDLLGITELRHIDLINRYDVEGISEELFESCIPTVFSEPQSDIATHSMPAPHYADEKSLPVHTFAVEFLPGQFDQRAESAAECVQLISQGERPTVRSARIYVLTGNLTAADIAAIKNYVINPVEAREASLGLPETLKTAVPEPADVEILNGFRELDKAGLKDFLATHGLAMDASDLAFCQHYFYEEHRDPTITEIRVIDTYWSDHCRHTTFNTGITGVQIDDLVIRAAFEKYLSLRHELGREDRAVSLWDMATIGAKYLRHRGVLTTLDESEEINACTVKVKVDVNGHDEDWLFLFKNETHNHPTEIEPFGGAATCIGGAIRDPLSGRSYVYQAMRVTGAADPTVPVSKTLPGKLPQRTIVRTAAAGYSSYGNQIGLATGQVSELYHPGYVAKRMEIGAVVGATPADHVRRERPADGDAIVLLGGHTGRDGIGGATGSSKAHDASSIERDGAEVQKGNAPVERKLQRLFRRGDACRLIKRCNDFGAGGVSVAIGELADGLDINLDAVPKKYDGLDGTELAISESQERMAVALDPDDVAEFCRYAREENLEATVVAHVTEDPRLVMRWRGEKIVNISRAFLASNGAPKSTTVRLKKPETYTRYRHAWAGSTLRERLRALVQDLNVASNKGLSERFDSTIGAATVLMPFGGTRQLTPALSMVAKLPVFGETTTVSGMAWGFNPYLMEADQFRGAYLSVVESVSRLVATGFDHTRLYLTFQEYFEKLRDDPARWGKPAAALLGALMAQIDLGIAAVGGKDSMSGSFEDLDVPPTLVSFATGLARVSDVVSPEFKGAGHRLVVITPTYDDNGLLPEATSLKTVFELVTSLARSGAALAITTPGYGGDAEVLFKSCLGNGIGVELEPEYAADKLFSPAYGSFIVELKPGASLDDVDGITIAPLGVTTSEYTFSACGEKIDLAWLQEAWERPLEGVFPYRSHGAGEDSDESVGAVENSTIRGNVDAVEAVTFDGGATRHSYSGPTLTHPARPRTVIPVFPGNNCEYDVSRAFERAGAEPTTLIINNLTASDIAESANALAAEIDRSQIVMIPGGFSGGDEPDGSAKFICALFRAPQVTEAVRRLLNDRDGLMLGICNGFQALIKLGLVPYGDIRPMDDTCPTLTFNTIGRHQSKLVRTRVASTLSPWLSRCTPGDIHTIAISHGEGRFVASEELLARLKDAGQIATQYVDAEGVPSMDLSVNPNGSVWAIEGITSPDGRVLGKMGHTERAGSGLYRNIPELTPGDQFQPLIEGGVDYFA
ncbi:phosphoribosylformylglycinamidine synthase [Atopobium sp. HMSC064B08]|nr:phosphoribosylformylglycinamidine synthase [Atopobium sp. HMSC064B08]